MILYKQNKNMSINMKEDVTKLKTAEITSDVFIIAPAQIDAIAKQFGDTVAETMNVKSLSDKIRAIAADVLLKTLQNAKKMGE